MPVVKEIAQPIAVAYPRPTSCRTSDIYRAAGSVSPSPTLRTVPLVPEVVLREQEAFIPSDTRFTAACRLLSALWQQDRGLRPGTYRCEPPRGRGRGPASSLTKERPLPGRLVRLGSRLAPAAARAGVTFLTPAIAAHVRAVLLFREPGALFEETRLWGNLLSSQALTLNLLAPLALDHDLATAVFHQLLPGFVGRVAGIRFEHSPGRRGPEYFGDGTALDALVDVVTPEGEPAFIAIEVKYVEGMCGPLPSPRPRYVEAARESGLYRDPDAALLTRAGFEQLRREHVMAQLMVRHGLAGRGQFLLIGPALNRRVHTVAKRYTEELIGDGEAASDRVGFSALTLERVVTAIAEAGAADLAAAFTARYLDLGRVADHVLAQPAAGLPRASRPARVGRQTKGKGNDATAPASRRKPIRSAASSAGAPHAATQTHRDVVSRPAAPKRTMSAGSTIRRGA